MKFRPKRISIRPRSGGVWRTVGVLEAAEDMRLADAMPDDTARVYAARDAARLALPWGDSCYTTAVYAQVDGWPRTVWCLGPVTDLAPSSEGPRGKARGDAYMAAALGREMGRHRG